LIVVVDIAAVVNAVDVGHFLYHSSFFQTDFLHLRLVAPFDIFPFVLIRTAHQNNKAQHDHHHNMINSNNSSKNIIQD
jgi:hypothetical protein